MIEGYWNKDWLPVKEIPDPSAARDIIVSAPTTSLEALSVLPNVEEVYFEDPIDATELRWLKPTVLRLRLARLTPGSCAAVAAMVHLQDLSLDGEVASDAVELASLDLSGRQGLVRLAVSLGSPREPLNGPFSFPWLPQLTGLKRLTLARVPLTPATVDAVATMSGLEYLSLVGMPKETGEKLLAALPRTDVRVEESIVWTDEGDGEEELVWISEDPEVTDGLPWSLNALLTELWPDFEIESDACDEFEAVVRLRSPELYAQLAFESEGSGTWVRARDRAPIDELRLILDKITLERGDQ